MIESNRAGPEEEKNNENTAVGHRCGVAIGAAGVFAYDAAGQAAKKSKRAPTVSFKEDVLPIFKGRCVECHAPGGKGFEVSGLDLQTHPA